MDDPKSVRTPVHRLINDRSHLVDKECLPPSQFEALRPLPINVRPAVEDARDALRRRTRA
jgi:hypothetical protein